MQQWHILLFFPPLYIIHIIFCPFWFVPLAFNCFIQQLCCTVCTISSWRRLQWNFAFVAHAGIFLFRHQKIQNEVYAQVLTKCPVKHTMSLPTWIVHNKENMGAKTVLFRWPHQPLLHSGNVTHIWTFCHSHNPNPNSCFIGRVVILSCCRSVAHMVSAKVSIPSRHQLLNGELL